MRRYSVAPVFKSIVTVPVEPTKLPWATASRRKVPDSLVDPCPEMSVAAWFICADPDVIVSVVPAKLMFPPVTESTYPPVRFPETANVIVPEAVPFVPVAPTTVYSPEALVRVIVWPTDTFAPD